MESGLLILPVLAVVIIVFLACRALLLWYWKIDEGIELLRSIDESLKQLPVVRQHYYRKSQNRNAA